MDVREKLVELIYKAEEQADKRCDFAENCDKCPANKQKIDCMDWLKADCLLSLGVTVQEWIFTDERMPTEDDAMDGYVAVVYVWGDGVKTKTISLVDVVIAHPDLYDCWMPLNLPQPPKGE